MSHRRGPFERWWPTTQSLDIVAAPIDRAATGVEAEVRRFVQSEELASEWVSVPDVDAAFSQVPVFANVPTYFVILPTRSRWRWRRTRSDASATG